MGVFKRLVKSKDGSKTAYWYIRYSVNGKEKWESVGQSGIVTKSVAQARLEERRRQVRLGQLDMIVTRIPALSEFSKEYLIYQRDIKQKRSWKKDESHLARWNKAFGELKLCEITAKYIDDYKLNRLTEVKSVTLNRELEVLRHLFYLAKKWKKVFGENPVAEAGLIPTESQSIRVLTLEEEERLISCSSPHLIPIVQAALMTGMRKGEITTLRWEDVSFDLNLITVRASVSKSKKARRIPISSTLRRILLEQKLKTSQTGVVFVTHDGLPYSSNNPNALKRAFGMACKRANIKGLRFHDLRHTAATRMAERGANIVAVKEILGHADIKTTMKYFHPGSSLIEAVEKLENFNQDRSNFRSNENQDKTV